jgi:hypothetical protein
MMRPTLLCTLLAATLLPACATDDPALDELDGESELDGEAGKGDTADAFTYFRVTPDKRACSLDADCGGFFVSRVNRATTMCGFRNPVAASECYVRGIHWAGMAMPASVAQSYEDRLRDGESILIRGDLANDPLDRGSVLAAKEVWIPGSETGEADGVFVMARDNGIRCITAPCAQITEMRLNANRTANIDTVDLTRAGADEQTVEIATNQLYAGEGLIVSGERFYHSNGRGKGRRAGQFWWKAPVPLH